MLYLLEEALGKGWGKGAAMAFIGRVFLGAVVCAVGLAAILVGLERAAAPADESAGEAAVENAPAPAPAEPAPPVDSDLGHPANRNLRINEAGLAIIKDSEGLRLEAYEAGGRWYIGYGHAGAEAGMTISEAEAGGLLSEDVAGAEAGVRRLVTVPVNENEFSAMVSLAYNLGIGGFARSSVLGRLNEGDRQSAAEAFGYYIRAGYQVLEHLRQRRENERTLFLTAA